MFPGNARISATRLPRRVRADGRYRRRRLAGVLANNGGPVQTIALKDDLSNPALDASNLGAWIDARGEARQDWAGIANQTLAGRPRRLELQNTAPTATNLTQAKISPVEDAASVALDNIVVSDADVGDTITARLTLPTLRRGC